MQKTLPKGWKIVKLGEVCTLINGKAFKPSDWSETGVPIIRIQNLNDPIKPFNYFHGEIEPRYHIKNGDVLLSWSGTPGTSFGAYIWQGGDAVLNQHIFRIELIEDIILKKIFVGVINWKLYELIRKAHGGVGLSHITKGRLENIQIPVPPLPTQHKIVEILEEADNLRKLRQQADEKMKDLIPSLFIKMFGDPVKNPKGWDAKKLGKVTNIRRGASPRPMGDPRYFGGSIPWIRITDIHRNGKFLKETEDHVTEEGARRSVYLKAGALIMAMAASIGTPCFLAIDGCIHDGFVVFEELSPDLDKEFLYSFITMIKTRFTSLAPEGTQKNLNTALIKSVPIPLPPLLLQQEFAKIVEDIESEKARQAETRKKLDELFNSLMQRAFTGEL